MDAETSKNEKTKKWKELLLILWPKLLICQTFFCKEEFNWIGTLGSDFSYSTIWKKKMKTKLCLKNR